MQVENAGSGVVHLYLATSDHKTNRAVLELELGFPFRLMLITTLLLSGP